MVTGDMVMEDTVKEDTDMDMIIMEVDLIMEIGADMISIIIIMEDTVVTVGYILILLKIVLYRCI